MQKNLTARSIVIVATLLLCVIGIIGFPKSKADLQENLRRNIRLGLDLKGGSHLVLQVQVQDAVKAEADQTMERLKEELRKQNIDFQSMDRTDPTRVEDADKVDIVIKGVPATKSSAFRSLINERFSNWVLTVQNSSDYSLRLKPSDLVALKRETVERSIQTISQRINLLGLTEPVVQQHGRAGDEFQILVQLPGVDDPAHVKDIIGTAAVLEITDVREGPFPSREAALSQKGGVLPLGTKLVKSVPRAGSQGDSWYLVGKTPVITGREMRNARPGQDDFRKWEAAFTLSPDGGKRFARYTEASIGKQLAVVLDNQIVSVATIQNRIEDSGRITGLGGEQEAVDLARYLKSGSLPAGVVYLDERSIGPSLGADSIHQGLVAGIVGLLAVVAVMLAYYKGAGVNAVLALILNTIVLMACLSYFHAVLTLPGIAGVILTVGMAVDSNVLIFERIREEL